MADDNNGKVKPAADQSGRFGYTGSNKITTTSPASKESSSGDQGTKKKEK